MFLAFVRFVVLCQVIAQSGIDEQLSRIYMRIENIRDVLNENHILAVYKDLNSLQELMNHINSEVAALESAASHQLEGHDPLQSREAEVALTTTDKIIEKLSLLDTKLVTVDDHEILNKIENQVLKMDEIDNFLQQLSNTSKENLIHFAENIKDTHGHFWIWTMSSTSLIFVLLSLKMLIK